MKAYPGYDDRPPPTGLNRGGGSDPFYEQTSQLDVRVARPRDAGVAAYSPSGGPSESYRLGLNGHSRIDSSPVSRKEIVDRGGALRGAADRRRASCLSPVGARLGSRFGLICRLCGRPMFMSAYCAPCWRGANRVTAVERRGRIHKSERIPVSLPPLWGSSLT